MIKLISSEKAVRLLESENVLVIEANRRDSKPKIKKEAEEALNVKIDSINTTIRLNKKICYLKLNKQNLAADIATKFGMI
jgi:ribosomal protein L23